MYVRFLLFGWKYNFIIFVGYNMLMFEERNKKRNIKKFFVNIM